MVHPPQPHTAGPASLRPAPATTIAALEAARDKLGVEEKGMDRDARAALTRQVEELYERYVQPLEGEHTGEYAAVSDDGRVVLASSLAEVMDRAEQELPPGS